MKLINRILILTGTLFLNLQCIKADSGFEGSSADSIAWWEGVVFFSVPVCFPLFFGILSAESSRNESRKILISRIMLTMGASLFLASGLTVRTDVSVLALISGTAYTGIGIWYLYLKEKYSPERISLRELPVTAKKLGLEYVESSVIDGVGDMEGIYDGYRVEVHPGGETGDGRFVVYLKSGSGKCDIRFHRPFYKPTDGMIEFKAGNLQFDSLFKTRYATEEFAGKIRNAGDKLDPVLNFINKWKLTKWWVFGVWGRSWIKVDGEAIRYSDVPVKGGSYVMHARRIERVLPDLVGMAQAVDEIAGKGN